jgi:hypothetical protein
MLVLSLALPLLSLPLAQSFAMSRVDIVGSNVLVTRPVIPLALSLLSLSQSFTTSQVDTIGRNLLLTRPVTSAFSFFLALSSTVTLSSACSSSSWNSQRLSRSFVTGRIDVRSNCCSDSPCDFRLLCLFFFRIRYLSFLFIFRSRSLLLRLCRFLSLL